jgi:hypothetical protein
MPARHTRSLHHGPFRSSHVMARATKAAKKNASSARRMAKIGKYLLLGIGLVGSLMLPLGGPWVPLRAKLTEWFLGLLIGPPPGALRNLLRDTLATRDQITADLAKGEPPHFQKYSQSYPSSSRLGSIDERSSWEFGRETLN